MDCVSLNSSTTAIINTTLKPGACYFFIAYAMGSDGTNGTTPTVGTIRTDYNNTSFVISYINENKIISKIEKEDDKFAFYFLITYTKLFLMRVTY